MLRIYSSLEQHLATIIAKAIIIKQIIKLIKNNFHAIPNFSTVKLLTKVPITKAGTNKLFSNLDNTTAVFSGTAFSFASKNPIKISKNRTTICPNVVDSISMLVSLSPTNDHFY